MKIKTLTSGKLNNNTYMVCNDNGECVLIDAAASLEDIIPRIEDYKVLGMFLTHGHYDHFVNIEKILDYYKIPCYITPPELEKLYNPKYNYSLVFGQFKICKTPKENFVLLKENDNIKLGSFDIKTYTTKGHTNGSICIDIDGNIFTGDTKFYLSYGRTDLLTGSDEDMQKSLKFLEDNFKGHTFYPGHGQSGTI